MNETRNRIDPRILRTRRLLRDAFVELLEEMELEKMSVNRIAERATINRVTFYLHYRDIPDMLEKLADEMVEDMKQILLQAPSRRSSKDGEWPMMFQLLEHIADNANFYKVVLASKRTRIFTERLVNLLMDTMNERLEKAGDHSPITAAGVQRDIAIWYGSSAIIGTIVAWLRKDMPYTPHYLSKQLSLLLPDFPKR